MCCIKKTRKSAKKRNKFDAEATSAVAPYSLAPPVAARHCTGTIDCVTPNANGKRNPTNPNIQPMNAPLQKPQAKDKLMNPDFGSTPKQPQEKAAEKANIEVIATLRQNNVNTNQLEDKDAVITNPYVTEISDKFPTEEEEIKKESPKKSKKTSNEKENKVKSISLAIDSTQKTV